MPSRSLPRHPRRRGVLRSILAFVVRVMRLSLMIVMVGPARGLGATPKVDDPDVRDHPEGIEKGDASEVAAARAGLTHGRPPR